MLFTTAHTTSSAIQFLEAHATSSARGKPYTHLDAPGFVLAAAGFFFTIAPSNELDDAAGILLTGTSFNASPLLTYKIPFSRYLGCILLSGFGARMEAAIYAVGFPTLQNAAPSGK